MTPNGRQDERVTGTEQPVPPFRSVSWRAGNALVSALARIGVGPMHLLTTTDRRTGRLHTIPVVPVEHDGKRWLVAPYGPVGWVRNARASGRVSLRSGRTERPYAIREVTAEQAGPVLKRYVAVAAKTRRHFRASADAPVEAFVAEADRHPVFELTRLNADAG